MIIHNPILTGSFTVNGTDVASITSSAASITAINAYTASQNILNGTYATTGSNTFKNPQTINSNLTVTGSITAATLVVQTITSSVIYSSGSNVFGNNIANTQVMTGSVYITGSVAIGTNSPLALLHLQKGSGNGAEVYTSYSTASVYSEFVHNINGGALNLKNENGGSNILLRSYGNSYINAQTGSVGIGLTTPTAQVQIYGTSTIGGSNLANARILLGTVIDGIGIDSNEIRSSGSALAMGTIDNFPVVLSSNSTNVLYVTGSNVGIGTASPTGLLDVASRGITKGSMPAGTVLQVVQTFKSDLFSIASGTPTDITGFSATITPTSSTSKILVFTTIHSASDTYPYPKLTLYRGSTAICLGTAGTNTTKVSIGAAQYSAGATPALYTSAQIFLDSPATTSAVTYKWQVYTFDAPNRPWYMNRTSGDSDANNHSAPSTITLMEIAQ